MPLLRTLLLNGTLGLAGYWTARHGFRMPAGLPRGLAAVTIAWAWATLGMEVLGPPGYLAYGPLLAWTSAGLAVAFVLRLRDRGGRGDGPLADPGPGEPWELSASLALGLVLWTTLMHGLSSLLGDREELVEVLMHVSIYAGVPATNAALRVAAEVLGTD